MKHINVLVRAFCASAMAFCLFASPLLAALPEKHQEYMKNESYKGAFEQFTAGMKEAKERFTPDEYANIEMGIYEVIAASIKEDMETGSSEADAYETAYLMGYKQVGNELRWDWLRKNAEDAQGFYRLKSDVFDGYMTLEKAEKKGIYAVNISLVMKKTPYNSGDFYGPGKLSGKKMIVPNDDDKNAVTILLDGESARVATTQTFKKSGVLGANVTLDGKYLREKK